MGCRLQPEALPHPDRMQTRRPGTRRRNRLPASVPLEVRVLLLLLAACSWLAPVPPDHHNVLVLLIDDIGVDKVGVYGSSYAAHTPHLDELASQGLRFDNAYSAPLCSPARSILLTGRHPRRTGIGTITERDSNATQLSLDATTIPEVLRHATEKTWSDGAVGKWHLAGPKVEDWPDHPNRSGFSWFAGVRGNPEYKVGRRYFKWTRNLNGELADDDRYLTTGTTDDALLRIEEMAEPWFLYVAYNAAHVPLHDPPAALRPRAVPAPKNKVDQHDAMVAVLDAEIGRLLDSMDPAVRARTTIIALGDNGTSRFGLRNGQGPGRSRIKHSVFEGGVRVPMIVTGPLVANPGTRTAAMVHIADVLPTMAQLAGVPVENDELVLPDRRVKLDGRSLLPILRGETHQGHPFIYSETFEPNGPGPYRKDKRGVRDATHKLMVVNGNERFFRLDPDGWWEQPRDLLEAPDTMSEQDRKQLAALRGELARLKKELVYEGR